MDKNTNYQKLKELIQKIVNENYFDDEDDLGSFSGEFDTSEFEGSAMRAAQKDIGKEFEPLGKSRFEKNLNPIEFKKDLQRQNLNLPKDKESLKQIQGTLDKRYKHEKQFGVGSMNEEKLSKHDPLFEALLNSNLEPNITSWGTIDINIFSMYGEQTLSFHTIIANSNEEIKKLYTANSIFQSHEGEGQPDIEKNVFFGDLEETVKFALRTHKQAQEELDSLPKVNMTPEEPHVGPRIVGKIDLSNDGKNRFKKSINNKIDENNFNLSSEFMKLSPQQLEHLKRINSTTLQSVIKHLNFLKVNLDTVGKQYKLSDWWDKLGYDEKHNRWYPVNTKQDIKNLASLPINMNEDIPSANKLERPKDSEGNPIILKSRVEDAITGGAGRVIRFGVDDNGKQTVHVEWIPSPMGQVPDKITYPDKIVVRDNSIKIKEGEIDESSILSHANGRGKNLKPGNFPETLKRESLKENLDQAETVDNDVFIVIDNDFNRAHYKDLIGKVFKDAPSYAQVKVVHPQDVEKEKSTKYDIDEDYDYATAEREYADRENLEQYANKKISVTNMNDIHDAVGFNPKRIDSILKDLHKELNDGQIQNNRVVASDYLDVQWIFSIVSVDDTTVTFESEGSAS